MYINTYIIYTEKRGEEIEKARKADKTTSKDYFTTSRFLKWEVSYFYRKNLFPWI